MKDKLPIKFFAHREIDVLEREGMGSKDLPNRILTETELKIRSAHLVEKFNNFIAKVEAKQFKQNYYPSCIELKIHEDFIAKTHRKHIARTFRESKKNNFLHIIDDKKILIRVNPNDMETIKASLQDTTQNIYLISVIEDINVFSPKIDVSQSCTNYKLKMLNQNDKMINAQLENALKEILKTNSIEYSKTEYSAKQNVFKLIDCNQDTVNLLKASPIYDSILSITDMPSFTTNTDSIDSEMCDFTAKQIDSINSVKIGVLDSGIADITSLRGLVYDRFSVYPTDMTNNQHGTYVSSVLLYGDELEGNELVGAKNIELLDACVVPDLSHSSVDEDELIQNIRDAVETHPEIKIWNLSLSISKEVVDDEFSDLAIALDSIQDEFDVLICKSAGNCSNYKVGLPTGRILAGADSVRSLVVGSVGYDKDQPNELSQFKHSTFSRVGTGPANIIKPDVAHFGGSIEIGNDGNFSINGIKVITNDNKFNKIAGTSFSTPRISALVGSLHNEIDSDFDPLLLKALTIHNTHSSTSYLNSDEVNKIGFGVPKSVTDILYNNPDEVTLILREDLAKGDIIDVFDFPVPDCLINESGVYDAQISVTLVCAPLLDPTQGPEYCQSDIKVSLGTYDKIKERDISKPYIKNEFGRDGNFNTLVPSNFSKRKLAKYHSIIKTTHEEKFLTEFGKFHPVKKYTFNLDDYTDGQIGNNFNRDKKWYLKLEGLYRDQAECNATAKTDLVQEFCLIITIKDPSGKQQVYEEMSNLLEQHNFWYQNIKLRNENRVQVSLDR